MTYRLDVEHADGEHRAFVVEDDDGRLRVPLLLRVAADRSLWIQAGWLTDESKAPGPELAEWIHDHAADFDAAGFNVRRWWHLWQCWDCMAPPLLSCRHHRTGEPLKRCHRGRRPRGARP